MGNSDLKRRLANADTIIMEASLNVQKQKEFLAEFERAGQSAEASMAHALLDMFQSRLRLHLSDRAVLIRGAGLENLFREKS